MAALLNQTTKDRMPLAEQQHRRQVWGAREEWELLHLRQQQGHCHKRGEEQSRAPSSVQITAWAALAQMKMPIQNSRSLTRTRSIWGSPR